MSERAERGCYTYRGTHIPGCYGCAIYGHHRCTCDRHSIMTGREYETRLRALEHRVAELSSPPTLGKPG